MATIIVNGCFDGLHAGHRDFLIAARFLCDSWTFGGPSGNRMIVALNSDESARRLKSAKWGSKYPLYNYPQRARAIAEFVQLVKEFDSEDDLREIIKNAMPCIIVKGPDYAGKSVTGDDIAPVLILDTPEPDSVKRWKVRAYGQRPFASRSPADVYIADTLSETL